VVLKQQGPWTYGALWNQVWSFVGNSARSDVSQMFVQPFLAYNTKTLWTITLQSESTANWEASDQQWTVPINLLSRTCRPSASFPASYQSGFGAFAVHPDSGPDWKIRGTRDSASATQVEAKERPRLITTAQGDIMKRTLEQIGLLLLAVAAVLCSAAAPAHAQPAARKPNVVVIMSDDVGIWNISAYHRGMMGGRTPNIDRIAHDGALFTDYYAQQSCTAGRAAFILGQAPFRTGLLKVGLPGAKQGIQDKDPTIAQLLKSQGYATAQVGKNHLGDRNEYLPTVHGFDEFFGNLYHLNSEEEPEDPDYPKDPEFHRNFGPRGVLDTKATDRDDPTEDPRFGRVGKQVIKATGPLTRKRMETAEEELLPRSLDFIDRSVKANKPFFLWHNTTRMHVWTHLSPTWENKSGFGMYADGMMELDYNVGEILKKLDDLRIADNTIVVFTSDNGAEVFSWPGRGHDAVQGREGHHL
jgi:arylsulfatase